MVVNKWLSTQASASRPDALKTVKGLLEHPVGRVTPNGVSLLGTAFFINRRGLLATAAHITGNNDSGLVVIMNKVNSIQDYQDTSNNEIQCIPANIKEINPIADVCILEVPTTVQSTFTLDSTDSVQVGEAISLFDCRGPLPDHLRLPAQHPAFP